ncbi:MAG: hypothetical protein HYX60_10500, partial [Legionella longbeachae]|nr:hypothetical protein [Legionella longbeachae]
MKIKSKILLQIMTALLALLIGLTDSTAFTTPNSCPTSVTASSYHFNALKSTVNLVWSEETALKVAQEFASKKQIDPSTISIKKLNGGGAKTFIYMIKQNNTPVFIIKGITEDEAKQWTVVQADKKLQDVIDKNTNGIAQIILNIAVPGSTNKIYTYSGKDIYGTIKTRYFIFMSMAKGMEFRELATKYWKIAQENPSLKEEYLLKLKKMFYQAGSQMSQFHKEYAGEMAFLTENPANIKTIINDDLHWENLFYDPETEILSVIDNAEMATSIVKPMSLNRELWGFYNIPIMRWQSPLKNDHTLKIPAKEMGTLIRAYLSGFANAFPNPEAAYNNMKEALIIANNYRISYLEAWATNIQLPQEDKNEPNSWKYDNITRSGSCETGNWTSH